MLEDKILNYHFENIINIENIPPILVAGYCYDGVSLSGIFVSDPLRRDWGNGINVIPVLGSMIRTSQLSFRKRMLSWR